MIIKPIKNIQPGQVYELTTSSGSSIPVLVLAVSRDDTVSTTRVYDSPRLINSLSLRVNNRTMYIDVSKMGFASAVNLAGLIGALSFDDMGRVHTSLLRVFNLSGLDSETDSHDSERAPKVENPVDTVETELLDYKALADKLKCENAQYVEQIKALRSMQDINDDLLEKSESALRDQKVETERVKAVSDIYEKLYHELLAQLTRK